MTISARIICDSIANDIRLTTLELCYPRFIHSEFMTHRMFSRNASSSRAIPVSKMIEQVRNNPAMPIHWGKNQPGMQAREETKHCGIACNAWESAAEYAADYAEIMALDADVHKQVANRLLEPFQYIKVIVTATEWDNFFNLRLHPDAQPEIMVLAEHIKEAMDRSTPDHLVPGEWHLPYITEDDHMEDDVDLRKLSVARCARISTLKHDGTSPSIEDDLKLYDRLVGSSPKHASPSEHVATPMDFHFTNWELWEPCDWDRGITHMTGDPIEYWSSNFRGWIQYRNLL